MSDTVDAAVKLAGERIDAWTAKLRSGEIKPLKGALTNRGGTEMCCLGVLCLVAGLERTDTDYDPGFIGPVTGTILTGFPPKCVANSVGIDEYGNLGTQGFKEDLFIIPEQVATKLILASEGDAKSLSQFNDWQPQIGFEGIADIIDANRDRMIQSVREKAEYLANR